MARRGSIAVSGTFLTLTAAALVGSWTGVGAYTFVYAKGASYLGHDPAACANCHVMEEQYSGWLAGPHRQAAACNDCHAPGTIVGRLATKGVNGFRHSLAFTTGWFPEPIRITAFNRRITERRCRDCHGAIVDAMVGPHGGGEAVACLRCHRDVGHLH